MPIQPKIISDITPTQLQAPKTKKSHLRFWVQKFLTQVRKYQRALLLLLIVLVVVIGFLASHAGGVRDPFTTTQQTAMGIPLYYPNTLPSGYHIDYGSVSIPQKGVIVFTIDGPKSSNIYVSEESTPSSDIVSRFTGSIVHPSTINTSLGSGIVGSLGNQSGQAATILTNNKTWIIVNSNGTSSQENLKFILRNLVVSS